MKENGRIVSTSKTEEYISPVDEMKLRSGLTAAILSAIPQINKRDFYLEIGACHWARVTPDVIFFSLKLTFLFYHLLYASCKCLSLAEDGYFRESSSFLEFGFIMLLL